MYSNLPGKGYGRWIFSFYQVPSFSDITIYSHEQDGLVSIAASHASQGHRKWNNFSSFNQSHWQPQNMEYSKFQFLWDFSFLPISSILNSSLLRLSPVLPHSLFFVSYPSIIWRHNKRVLNIFHRTAGAWSRGSALTIRAFYPLEPRPRCRLWNCTFKAHGTRVKRAWRRCAELIQWL